MRSGRTSRQPSSAISRARIQRLELVAVSALFGFLNRWNDTMATELEAVPHGFAEQHLGGSGWAVGKHR